MVTVAPAPDCEDRWVIAKRPDSALPIPEALRALFAGRRAEVVWRNQSDGLTIEVTSPAERRFVKWAPAGSGLNLVDEEPRLRWAADYITVPRVLDSGSAGNGHWLITAAVAGTSAVAPRWQHAPEIAVAGVGAGLRKLHDALPVPDCPFSWSTGLRIAGAARRAELGMLRPDSWHPEHLHLTVDEALHRASAPPAIDKLVVCHGDACAPNTLLDDDGRPAGHVDLGALGVADRWADLAVATWSADWNFGPGWQDTLLNAYGVEPDRERLAYYRLLWDLGP
jgi:kanamycin kinase